MGPGFRAGQCRDRQNASQGGAHCESAAPIRPRGWRIASVVALTLLLLGCADRSSIRGVTPLDAGDSVELRDTPFFSQTADQCGPAALATLLVHAGRQTSPAALAERIYLPGREGSLQFELFGATRREGLVPYSIEPTLAALVTELGAGRPVLVLQNLGLSAVPIWHYAVVIGYDSDADEIILRSGTTRRKVTAADRFLGTWGRADFWGFVVLAPGELPARPDRTRYLAAIAALEAVGQFEAALTSYRAALEPWPRDTIALLGIGNSLYGLGDIAAAEKAYRRLVEEDPSHLAGYNNLAQVLADQGHYDQALALVSKALSLTGANPDLRRILQETRAEIRQERGSDRRFLNACDPGTPTGKF